jgi:Family of unknown function (DUF6505)
VKLLRTIRLDASDLFVFEKAAEPGEWAVSGAFAFAHFDLASLRGKARIAFRAGLLGLDSLGRSTLAQIVEANEGDRRDVVETLAAQLVKRFGAPDLATARLAAEEETDFAASLCDHSPGVLVAVTRSHENGEIRETFRTLRPRDGAGHARAFEFLQVVGDDDVPVEHVDLTGLFRDPADMTEKIRSEPVYLLVAMAPDGLLRLKPQNLLGLPIRQKEAVN